MKFACERCGKKYATAEDPAPGRVYKLKCKACGHIIVVRASAGGAGASSAGNSGRRTPTPVPAIPPPLPDLPDLSFDVGGTEPAEANGDLPPGLPGLRLGDSTTEISMSSFSPSSTGEMPAPAESASGAGAGYVDLFADIGGAVSSPEEKKEDPFLAAARASLPDTYGSGASPAPDLFGSLSSDRLPPLSPEPSEHRPTPPTPKIPVIPKPPPQKSGAPIALIAGGLVVLVGILVFTLFGMGKKAPPRAQHAAQSQAQAQAQPAAQAQAPVAPAQPDAQAQAPAASAQPAATPPLAAGAASPGDSKAAEEQRAREEQRRRDRDQARERDRVERAARDRDAKEARDREAKEARDRDRVERAARDRDAKEARDRDRAERAARDREAKEAKQRERQERERLAREAKAERARQVREAADRARQEREARDAEKVASAAGGGSEGGLTPAQMEKVLSSTKKAFEGCIRGAKDSDVKLDGRRVMLRLNIQTTGAVTYPTLDDVTLNGTELGQCLKNAARLMVFPKFNGDTMHVEVPLVLRP